MNPGDRLPDFRLPDETGTPRAVGDLAGPKGLVLYAYPKDDTPGCTIQAQDFRDTIDTFREAGFGVAGISMDDAGSHCSFRDKYGLNFPLLTDAEGGFLRSIGAYGVKNLYGRKVEGVLRSTVVVDPEGTVLRHYPNVRAQGHAERVLEDLGKL